MPTSMASAPAPASASTVSSQLVVHPAGDVGHQQLAAGVPPGGQGGLEEAGPVVGGIASGIAPSASVRRPGSRRPDPHGRSRSRTWATSLSPRPDRLTSTVDPLGRSGVPARAMTQAMAWAGLEGRDDALGAGQALEGLEDLVVVGRLVAGPARLPPGGRARGRCPDSRDRPRWTGPRGSARPRPAGGRCACRGGRRGCPWSWPRRRPPPPPPAGHGGVDEAGEDARRRWTPRRHRPPPRRGRRRRAARRHCSRASSPMTRWNSRTIHGYGCGPITEPRQ